MPNARPKQPATDHATHESTDSADYLHGYASWQEMETAMNERALAFLSQHLVVLVPATALVADLVTAQARLPVPPPHHLTWMSGPSKTADIEQTLVVGAHGSRSLTVICYDSR